MGKKVAKTTKNGKAVVKANPNAVPAFIPKDADTGLEKVRSEDLQLPRMVLMQGQSPLVLDGDFSPGDIVSSLTDELISPKDTSITVIPTFYFVSWIEWRPRDEGGGIIDMSEDPKSEIAVACANRVMIDGDKGPVQRVTEYHNFVIIVVPVIDKPIYYHVSLAKTNHKIGKKWLSLAVMREAPLYAGKYELSTKDEMNNQKQKYKVFEVKNAGWVEEKEFEASKKLHDMLKKLHATNALKYSVEDAPIDTEIEEEM